MGTKSNGHLHGIIRFGPFDLDTYTGELRKHGIRVRFQEKSFQMLIALLERPGEVVTRDELQRRLWGTDTVVDFESGLNTSAKRLRAALSDSAEKPRYVETVARVGYRYIAPLQIDTVQTAPVQLIPLQIEQPSNAGPQAGLPSPLP